MHRSSPRAPDSVMLSAIAVAVVVGKLMFAGIPAPEWTGSAREHQSHAASIDASLPLDDAGETANDCATDAAGAQAVESATWPDRAVSNPAARAPAPSPQHVPSSWPLQH